MATVFFSWQSDRSDGRERALIERALTDALSRITSDATVEPAIRQDGITVDRDTKGVPGTPPIVDTIFAKIDKAMLFVPDLTFVATRADGRPSPNPNVLIEYGWALKALTHARMLPVMNSYYGDPTPETMPFDMKHLRFPIAFKLPPSADATHERTVSDELSENLEAEMRTILASQEFKRTLSPPPAFPAAEPKQGQSRFRAKGEPLGKTIENFMTRSRDVFLTSGPAMWLRLMPVIQQPKRWTTSELKKAAVTSSSILCPLGAFGSAPSLDWVRGADGFGVFASVGTNETTPTVVYVFETGEVWSVDTVYPNASGGISLAIPQFTRALDQYRIFLKAELGILGPYQYFFGVEGVKDKPVWLEGRRRVFIQNPFGSCIQDLIVIDGQLDDGTKGKDVLRPFSAAILEKCGCEDRSILDEMYG